MSKGSFEFKSFNTKCYINLKLTPEDWCTYEGQCRVKQLLLQNGTCDCCQYKRMINVPELLDRIHNEHCEVVRSKM
jgi:hypothetical protein